MNIFDNHLDDVLVEDYLRQAGADPRPFSEGFQFRCLSCGDSKTDATKKRGFVLHNSRGYRYYCHNCNTNMTFTFFLKEKFPTVFNSMLHDIIAHRRPTPKPKPKPKLQEHPGNEEIIEGLHPIHASPVAIDYLLAREIPQTAWQYFLYHENFQKFLKDKGYSKDEWVMGSDPRIVFPFYNRVGTLTHLQGRAIDSNERLRYRTATIKPPDPENPPPKVWGLEHVDLNQTVYISEGVFDAVFMPNGIAMTGGGTNFGVLQDIGVRSENGVVCMDGDIWENLNIQNTARKAVEAGYGIFLFPRPYWTQGAKDLNDLVKKKLLLPSEIPKLLQSNTHRDLNASVILNSFFPEGTRP